MSFDEVRQTLNDHHQSRPDLVEQYLTGHSDDPDFFVGDHPEMVIKHYTDWVLDSPQSPIQFHLLFEEILLCLDLE